MGILLSYDMLQMEAKDADKSKAKSRLASTLVLGTNTDSSIIN